MKDKKQPKCVEEYVSTVCLMIMMVLLSASVIGRLTGLFAVSFTEEIVVQLFLVMSMFAISSCAMEKKHMGLSLLTDTFHGKVKIASLIFAYVIEVIMFVLLGYLGIMMVISQYKYNVVTPVLQMNKFIFTLSFPIGSALYIIRITQLLIVELKEALGK